MQTISPTHLLASTAAAPRPMPVLPRIDRDAQFVDLLNNFRHSGGLARATDVLASMRQRGSADIATMARWIVQREVVHLEWQGENWLPLFQFDGADLQPHAAVRRSMLELHPVMPPWELAQWFARPHGDLAGRRPADALAADPTAVWQAARADRYALDA